MPVPLKLVFLAVKGQFADAMHSVNTIIARAATGTMNDTAAAVKQAGREKIAAAGFGPRWQNAFRTEVFPRKGISAGAAVHAWHKIPYAGIFERGGDIRGKRGLLWIPVSGAPTKIAGRRLTPASYQQIVGPLQIVHRPGHPPMLVGYIQGGSRGRGKITVSKLKKGHANPNGSNVHTIVLFFGMSFVHIKAKLQLEQVFTKARNDLPSRFSANLRKVNK